MTQEKKVLLNAHQLEAQGYILTDILNDISIISDLINFLPHNKDIRVQENPLFYYELVNRSLGNVYQKLQDMEQQIDDVATILLCVNDKDELETLGLDVFEEATTK